MIDHLQRPSLSNSEKLHVSIPKDCTIIPLYSRKVLKNPNLLLVHHQLVQLFLLWLELKARLNLYALSSNDKDKKSIKNKYFWVFPIKQHEIRELLWPSKTRERSSLSTKSQACVIDLFEVSLRRLSFFVSINGTETQETLDSKPSSSWSPLF